MLIKPYRGSARLLFSFFNSQGEHGARIFPRDEQAVGTRFLARLSSMRGTASDMAPPPGNDITGPVIQVQLMATSKRPIAQRDREELVQFFQAARQQVREASLKKLRGS
jgi:hypothetical protein